MAQHTAVASKKSWLTCITVATVKNMAFTSEVRQKIRKMVAKKPILDVNCNENQGKLEWISCLQRSWY